MNLLFYNPFRLDDVSVFFFKCNILQDRSSFQSYFSPMSLDATCELLKTCGVYFKTNKRHLAMYCYGSTITATQYPKFIKDGKHCILPRPYEKSKPGKPGHILLHTRWFSDLCEAMEDIVLSFLAVSHPNINEAKLLLEKIKLAKTYIPKELRISNTFFTHMTFMGNMNNGDEIPLHFDEKDTITALFHFGSVSSGGCTEYFNGISVKEAGSLKQSIPFENGRVQVGCFNKVLHKATKFSGSRFCLNFNLKQSVLDHFLKEESYFFDQYKLHGFPQGTFYAT